MKGNCADHEAILVASMDEDVKECLLYLPLFDQVDQLEIGVDKGSAIKPLENPFRHRIISTDQVLLTVQLPAEQE